MQPNPSKDLLEGRGAGQLWEGEVECNPHDLGVVNIFHQLLHGRMHMGFTEIFRALTHV